MRRSLLASVTLTSFLMSSCGGKSATEPAGPTSSPLSDQVLVQSKDLPPGLQMRVSDGTQGPPAFDRATLAPATKLVATEATTLLSRATPLKSDPADYQRFALRPGSQPAPRTGTTILASFPAPASTLLPPSPVDTSKALRVLRFMPEGAVPVAPELSVTFSQPMVAVTSQTDAAATTPVKLTPTPPGQWRWIGTRTILFDPAIRFPQATTYQVEVPAGTRSVNGGTLPAATKFSFETPALTLERHVPSEDGEPQPLDRPIFLQFDQRIDPTAVLAKIAVTAEGKAQRVRMLEPGELAANKELASMVEATKKAGKDGRWLAFRTIDELPVASDIRVEVLAGAPSAEGPNRTPATQGFDFRTYSPLVIDAHRCGWDQRCPPGTPFVVEFNNPLDAEAFSAAQITITPELANVQITTSGDVIMSRGLTAANTKYTMRVAAGVLDSFGQTLGKDTTLEFRVGDARPTFYGPSGVVVLDPAAKRRTLDFFTTNYDALKVKLHKVSPADFDAYNVYLRNAWDPKRAARIPGKQVVAKTIPTTGGKNELVETGLDLTPALDRDGFGHALAIVEPSPWTEDYPPPQMIAWVQSTRLGIDAYVDGEQMIAMATELATGKSAAGVAVEIRPFGIKATTNAQGIATLPLATQRVKGSHYLVAKQGADTAFVAESDGYWNESGNWIKRNRGNDVAWYVVDDRKLYKPGEEVTLKGWLRDISYAKGGDVGGLDGAISSVSYVVTDSRGNELLQGSAKVSRLGSFDTKFTLPKTPNLGYAYVSFQAKGQRSGSYSHSIRIEEFRRPEFEVTAQASQGPFLVGSGGDVTVNAKYYAGGPLAGAAVNWYLSASPTQFTPPNRDEFTFGEWTPWWGWRGWGAEESAARGQTSWDLQSKTDATGAHTLHMDYLSVKPSVPMAVTASASVADVNRQSWTASAALIIHPSTRYVGVKIAKPFVEKGVPMDLEIIGVDLDGKATPGVPIEVRAVRREWKWERNKLVVTEKDPQTCAVTAAASAVPCRFQTPAGGEYQVTAVILDAQGRANLTKLEFYVTGGDNPPARELALERVQIIPDRKDYQQGDTAELLVQAPFYPAEALVTWRRSGIVKMERITLAGPTATVKVPITETMVPNLHVQVDLVGSAARSDDQGQPDPKLPRRPAYAVGQIMLPVPPRQRTLAVTVAPNVPKLGPGESAQLTVVVRDAAGKPVPNAETAVIVVDEAILTLAAYSFPNPVDAFYPQRGTDTTDHYSRAYVKLAKPSVDMLAQQGPGDGAGRTQGVRMESMPSAAPAPAEMDQAERSKKSAPARNKSAMADAAPEPPNAAGGAIAVRSNFNPLAAFAPTVMTDAQGRAVVSIKVPDNLTRYRIVALATAGTKQFGKGESAITARLPLMVRPSPPRFLNFGDTFKLPVVVQNQTDAPMTVKLAVRATNATLTDGQGRMVTVPANDRVEVQFPAAAELAGTARFQIVGTAGTATDAAEVALPVWTPATTEAFATYGVIDSGAVKQPVALPGQVVTQFGGLEVTTASTNLQALTDAMLYLVKYPFECAEQRASRVLAVAALRDVLSAFKTKGMPSPAALEASVTIDIERLAALQNYDGGFTFWQRGYPSNPYVTVYVTSALVHAKAKGYTVPDAALDRAKPYLKDIERHYSALYPPQVRWAISAYALYTRKQYGDVDVAKAKALVKEAGGVGKLTMETVGWLIGTLAKNKDAEPLRKELVRHAMNKVSETAGAANFTTSYGDGAYLILASDRRVDSVLLEALIQEQPGLDLIPKLVTGLLAHRKAGRWLNTQENTFALLAMDLYFQTYEKATPNFVARVWLGNDYAGDHAFKGRTTEYHAISIPMVDVATHDKQPLTIQKDGTGRLYYRVGMTYAPASLKLEPADYGFVVQREYEGVDAATDVVRQADGTWKIKAGARVRVKLKMVNENRRYHVALVDPLPAGLEPMNPALATTGPIPQGRDEDGDASPQGRGGRYWWWYGPWYEHQNMRDERVEAFASMLWEGVHTYEYVARATTPGTFIVPPPKAEEMYMPETFGRGGSDRVVVE